MSPQVPPLELTPTENLLAHTSLLSSSCTPPVIPLLLHLRFGRSPVTGQNGLFWPVEEGPPCSESGGADPRRPNLVPDMTGHEAEPGPSNQPISPPSSESLRVIRVPLDLVLSDSVPRAQSPPLDCIPLSLTWEIRLGAILLWAAASPGTLSTPLSVPSLRYADGGSQRDTDRKEQLRLFWSRYKTAFIPDSSRQTSLLLWPREDLQELQVSIVLDITVLHSMHSLIPPSGMQSL